MPPRIRIPKRLLQQWPPLDLPILPFLAPRVFTPWPFPPTPPARRAFSSTIPRHVEGQSKKQKEDSHADDILSLLEPIKDEETNEWHEQDAQEELETLAHMLEKINENKKLDTDMDSPNSHAEDLDSHPALDESTLRGKYDAIFVARQEQLFKRLLDESKNNGSEDPNDEKIQTKKRIEAHEARNVESSDPEEPTTPNFPIRMIQTFSASPVPPCRNEHRGRIVKLVGNHGGKSLKKRLEKVKPINDPFVWKLVEREQPEVESTNLVIEYQAKEQPKDDESVEDLAFGKMLEKDLAFWKLLENEQLEDVESMGDLVNENQMKDQSEEVESIEDVIIENPMEDQPEDVESMEDPVVWKLLKEQAEQVDAITSTGMGTGWRGHAEHHQNPTNSTRAYSTKRMIRGHQLAALDLPLQSVPIPVDVIEGLVTENQLEEQPEKIQSIEDPLFENQLKDRPEEAEAIENFVIENQMKDQLEEIESIEDLVFENQLKDQTEEVKSTEDLFVWKLLGKPEQVEPVGDPVGRKPLKEQTEQVESVGDLVVKDQIESATTEPSDSDAEPVIGSSGSTQNLAKETAIRTFTTPDLIASAKRFYLSTDTTLQEVADRWRLYFMYIVEKHRGATDCSIPECYVDALPDRLQMILSNYDVDSLRKQWLRFYVGDASKKRAIWSSTMLAILDHCPEKAMEFLEATYATYPSPYKHAVSTSLGFIISHQLHNKAQFKPGYDLPERILHMCKSRPRNIIVPEVQMLKLLASLQSEDPKRAKIVKELYAEVAMELYALVADQPLQRAILIRFAHILAMLGKRDVVLEVLQKLHSQGEDFQSESMMRLSTFILSQDQQSRGDKVSKSEIFQFLLERGFKPSLLIYNVLIRDAFRSQDPATAWHIYDEVIKNGIEPDAYTYSILLRSAKRRMDKHDIQRIMELIPRDLNSNPHIVTDIIHSFWLFNRFSPQSAIRSLSADVMDTSFGRMLIMYRKHFHDGPLAQLIPEALENCPAREDQLVESKTLIDPPVPTLKIMIAAYLDGLRAPHLAKAFYDRFLSLVIGKDPALLGLLGEERYGSTTYMWDLILMTFARFPDCIGDCPVVLRDMLSLGTENSSSANNDNQPSSPAVESNPSSRFASNFKVAPPSIYTWSILVKIFMDQEQNRAAEKIIEMMQARGVKPTIITWNTLVGGYVRLQDMPKVMDSMARMRDGGVEVDESIKSTLQRIADRRQLRDLGEWIEKDRLERLQRKLVEEELQRGREMEIEREKQKKLEKEREYIAVVLRKRKLAKEKYLARRSERLGKAFLKPRGIQHMTRAAVPTEELALRDDGVPLIKFLAPGALVPKAEPGLVRLVLQKREASGSIEEKAKEPEPKLVRRVLPKPKPSAPVKEKKDVPKLLVRRVLPKHETPKRPMRFEKELVKMGFIPRDPKIPILSGVSSGPVEESGEALVVRRVLPKRKKVSKKKSMRFEKGLVKTGTMSLALTISPGVPSASIEEAGQVPMIRREEPKQMRASEEKSRRVEEKGKEVVKSWDLVYKS